MTPHSPSPTLRLAGSLLVALILAGASLPAAGEGPRLATVSGTVEIGSGEPPVWRPAAAGDPLASGDAIRTGHDGRAELALASGSVRLYANSLLRLPAASVGDSERIRLERGRSLFDVLRRRDGVFEVETREVVVSVKGTRFGVETGAGPDQVAVFRGLVGVRGADAGLALETLVREGFAAVGGADRPFELLLNGAPDPWDAWSAGELAPLLLDRAAPPGPGPSALLETPPPAALALAEARAAARHQARPEVIELAMERDPELRARVEQLVDERRKAAGQTEIELPDLSAGRDPVGDATGDGLRRQVQTSFIESIVTGAPSMGGGGGGGGGAGGGPLFEVLFQDGSGVSGGDQIQILAGGSTYSFDDDDVEDLLEGDDSLPAPLLAFLAGNGVAGPQIQALIAQLGMLLGDDD